MAEVLVFEGAVTGVGITEVCEQTWCCWRSVCLSWLVVPLISFGLACGSPPGGSLAVMTRPRFES